ncbi:Piwi-domain-containing protein [Martensiomyces pterosporus]|nr:Piwi-domain-containing protein [Martensiomyces pterosporus]
MYVLDCLFRLHPTTKLRFMANAYVTDQHAIKTANGFDIWWGYQQTVRPGEGSLFLIIHTKPMPVVTSATLSEAALMFSRSKTVRTLADMTPKEWNSFTPVVRGLQVSIPGTPQVWLAGLSQNQAKNEQIDGVPVAKYYSDTFGVTIRNLESPCALTALGVPVPLELCRILPGQMLPRVSGRQLNQLCTHGAASPELRRRIIDIGINDLDFASNPDLQAFGIRVNPQPENFRARILPPPQLLMHRNGAKHPVQINEGRWGIGGHKVVDTTQLKSWAIVCFANKKMYPPAVVSAFASQLMKTCKEIGIDVLNVAPQIRYDTISSNIDQALSHACHLAEASSGGERAQMVLCILPSTSASLYGEIKRVATTIVGVQTQCIQAANIVAHKPKILSLIALKMNVKLGGYSTELSDGDRPCISERPTMVISADVSHATESGNMSVAAILSSVDLQCKRFQGIVLQHPKKMEFIENFDVIIRQCLRLFYKNTQQKPERIVYFRDGVGDATINKVKDLELQAIYKGCSLIDPNYRPKVTVLLVRKRHHTRFLPVEGSSKCCSQEGNGNCLPGTLVDRGAVNPTMTNFYLLSHTTKAGTARPLYYMMLHDDSGLDPQQLKTLTHNLSYTYPIVTKTATMPAPVYYAHRLTAQGRFHINQPFNSLPKFTARPGTRSSQKQRGQQQPPHLVPVHRNLQDTMYFM